LKEDTSEEQARERIATLREQIRRHDHLYYVVGRPDIADAAYDGLLRDLIEL
jgi:DNA ligase (NAD+)